MKNIPVPFYPEGYMYGIFTYMKPIKSQLFMYR